MHNVPLSIDIYYFHKNDYIILNIAKSILMTYVKRGGIVIIYSIGVKMMFANVLSHKTVSLDCRDLS